MPCQAPRGGIEIRANTQSLPCCGVTWEGFVWTCENMYQWCTSCGCLKWGISVPKITVEVGQTIKLVTLFSNKPFRLSSCENMYLEKHTIVKITNPWKTGKLFRDIEDLNIFWINPQNLIELKCHMYEYVDHIYTHILQMVSKRSNNTNIQIHITHKKRYSKMQICFWKSRAAYYVILKPHHYIYIYINNLPHINIMLYLCIYIYIHMLFTSTKICKFNHI